MTQNLLITPQLSLLLVNNLATKYCCPGSLNVAWIANYLKNINNEQGVLQEEDH